VRLENLFFITPVLFYSWRSSPRVAGWRALLVFDSLLLILGLRQFRRKAVA